MKIIVVFCVAIAGVLSAPPPYNKYNFGQQTTNKYNQNVGISSFNKFNQNVALPTLNKYNQKVPAVPTLNNQYNRKNDDKTEDQSATIIRYESTNDGQGNYEFEYETSDGQTRKERGELVQVEGAEEPVVKVTGSYTYRDPENQSHTINYVADENGYRSMEESSESTRRKVEPQVVSFSSPSRPLGILGTIGKTLG